MLLTRLVYASSKISDVSPNDLQQILNASDIHNARHSVTGMLCFDSKYFMQFIEGGRTMVNETYNRLVRDERHTDVVLLDYSAIHKRDFGAWSMGCVSEGGLDQGATAAIRRAIRV